MDEKIVDRCAKAMVLIIYINDKTQTQSICKLRRIDRPNEVQREGEEKVYDVVVRVMS